MPALTAAEKNGISGRLIQRPCACPDVPGVFQPLERRRHFVFKKEGVILTSKMDKIRGRCGTCIRELVQNLYKIPRKFHPMLCLSLDHLNILCPFERWMSWTFK